MLISLFKVSPQTCFALSLKGTMADYISNKAFPLVNAPCYQENLVDVSYTLHAKLLKR